MKKKIDEIFQSYENEQLKFNFFEIDDRKKNDKKKSTKSFAHAKKLSVENFDFFEIDDKRKNRRDFSLVRRIDC